MVFFLKLYYDISCDHLISNYKFKVRFANLLSKLETT